MILESYYLGCLSHASYLLGDEATGTAIVVDPQRDVDQYVEDAERLGLTIGHVVLTHFHADFLAGHLELRRRTGATVHLGAGAEAEYPFEVLTEGTAWDLPGLRVDVLATPGHTPEAVSLVVGAPDAFPHAVLTGDALFRGDVGRPDLVTSRGHTAEALARQLHASLQKLRSLPDGTLVLPAHGAGSSCGRSIAGLHSTIGAEKRDNMAFGIEDRDAFVRFVTQDLPPAPAYFQHDAELNRQERAVLEDALADVRPLPLEAVLSWANRGAQVVDTRDPEAFARGHLAGSINVGIDGDYAPWAGAVLDPHAPVLLVTAPGREHESALRLGRIGFDNVVGHLATPLEDAAEALHSVVRADARDLHGRFVLDVRSPAERTRSVPGSTSIPLTELARRLEEVPPGPLLVHCASGYRSSIAASLLRRAGWSDVKDLRGGIDALEVAA